MAIASITAWLNNPSKSYEHGRLLYEQYGSSRAILRILSTGNSSFHFAKLQAALEEVNKQSNLEPKPIVLPEHHLIAPERPGDRLSEYKDAPEKILEIRNEKNRHYAQARRLFEQIRMLDSQAQRLDAGLQILDHMDYVSEAWSAIDEWKKDGRIREIAQKQAEKEVAELSLVEMIKEEKNLRTYISKDKAKLETAESSKKKIDIAERLQARSRRLDLIRGRLQNELV